MKQQWQEDWACKKGERQNEQEEHMCNSETNSVHSFHEPKHRQRQWNYRNLSNH